MIKKLIQSRILQNKSEFYKVDVLKQPKLKMRTSVQILPPPGLNLQIPDWDPNIFLLRIGGGVSEYSDKFENINEIFTLKSKEMKEKGLPARHRKYILDAVEQMRRGILTFEYLERRTCLEIKKNKK